MFDFEVVGFKYSIKDMHYVVEVVPSCSLSIENIVEIRLPYKPQLGQIIQLKG